LNILDYFWIKIQLSNSLILFVMEENKPSSGIVTKVVIAVVVLVFIYGIYWLLNGGMDGASLEGSH